MQSEGTVEPDRLKNNLLSSQPLCFNLFGPLGSDLGSASQAIAGLLGVPHDIRVTAVKIEFAPPAESHLEDRTAFDAWIEYEGPNGRGFIGIETKLTEPFSQASYSAEKPGYAKWLTRPDGWWNPDAIGSFGDQRY